MGAPYPNALLDTIGPAPNGLHSGLPITLLQKTQDSFAVNVTYRGGYRQTRPNIRKLSVTYADETTEGRATQAMFQDASPYEAYGQNRNCLVSSIGGRIFRYLVANNTVQVQEISPPGDINNPTRDQAWMFQGEEFLIINDGLSLPIFFDGASTRRSIGASGGATNSELPPGCMGYYGGDRIVMVLPDRRSYIAGDLVYGKGASGGYGGRDAILKTTENLAILGGAAFAVPINSGSINAVFTIGIPDTSLGHGPTQIGTGKGIFSVNLPIDSNQWTTTNQPTAVVGLPSKGPVSQYSVNGINGDSWYRASDGIRSYAIARRDYNTWVQTPLSFELERILPFDTANLTYKISAVDFNNRRIETCSPYRVEGRGIAHRGMTALDFNNISSLTTRSQPNYDGLWTGLNVLKIITATIDGVERCFIFALDESNDICLYELMYDNDAMFDYNGSEDVAVESWVETYSLFGLEVYPPQTRLPLKKLVTSDLFLDQLAGTVSINVKYRSDQYPFWVDWNSFSVCATACVTPTDCSQPQESQLQYATFRRLPEPQDTCNPASGRQLRSGYYFQVRLQWTGHAELRQMLTWAVPIPETLNVTCSNEPCKVLSGCSENLFTYSIE